MAASLLVGAETRGRCEGLASPIPLTCRPRRDTEPLAGGTTRNGPVAEGIDDRFGQRRFAAAACSLHDADDGRQAPRVGQRLVGARERHGKASRRACLRRPRWSLRREAREARARFRERAECAKRSGAHGSSATRIQAVLQRAGPEGAGGRRHPSLSRRAMARLSCPSGFGTKARHLEPSGDETSTRYASTGAMRALHRPSNPESASRTAASMASRPGRPRGTSLATVCRLPPALVSATTGVQELSPQLPSCAATPRVRYQRIRTGDGSGYLSFRRGSASRAPGPRARDGRGRRFSAAEPIRTASRRMPTRRRAPSHRRLGSYRSRVPTHGACAGS